MKAVLISINKPNTDNIIGRAKTSELRTKAPCITTPFKVYIYETKRYGGCGKVIGEFTCFDKVIWRIPMHGLTIRKMIRTLCL